jgi:hypothetical protein
MEGAAPKFTSVSQSLSDPSIQAQDHIIGATILTYLTSDTRHVPRYANDRIALVRKGDEYVGIFVHPFYVPRDKRQQVAAELEKLLVPVPRLSR